MTTKIHLYAVGSFIAMLFLLVPLSSSAPNSFENCDSKGSYDVEVEFVDSSPSPMKYGVEPTIKIEATTDKEISGGQLVVDLYSPMLTEIPLAIEEHDLCEVTSCPILPGDFVIEPTLKMLASSPPDDYYIMITLKDADGKQLSCTLFYFHIYGSAASEGVASS